MELILIDLKAKKELVLQKKLRYYLSQSSIITSE
jgi:hypothetical protein